MPADSSTTENAVDVAAARRNAARAAPRYRAAAALPRELSARLAERLDVLKIAPKIILDAGCGTGDDARMLRRRFPDAAVLAVDHSLAMLQHAREVNSEINSQPDFEFFRAQADVCRLPLADGAADLLYANLIFEWTAADVFAREAARVLRPGGLFMAATLGPDSLREARAAQDILGGGARVHDFADMHDIGDILSRAGFEEQVAAREMLTLRYSTPRAALEELRALGAAGARRDRPRGLLSPRKWRRFLAACQKEDGVNVTIEAALIHGWRAEPASEEQPVQMFPRRPV